MQTPKAALAVWGAAKPLLDEGKVDDAREVVLGALSALVARNAELELLLKQLRASGRGATSEKVSAEQLSLLTALMANTTPETAEPSVEVEEAADAALDKEIEQASEAAAASSETTTEKKRTRNTALRLGSLPVVETVLPIPEDKSAWRLIGYDETDRLRYSPAHFYRELIKSPVLEGWDLLCGQSAITRRGHV